MQLPIACRAFLAFGALALAAGASQPPWDKPAEAWSPADIAAVLNSSPWAVSTSAVMQDPRYDREEQPAGPPDTGGAGLPSATPKPRWNGEITRNSMGQPATLPVLVRWDSALPVRQAQKDAAAPADFYVVSLSGLIPANRYRAAGHTETTSSSDSSIDARNPEELLEAFMGNSKIFIKGSRPLQPENVKLDPATGTVRVFFSRKQAIDTSQKELLFVTRFGTLSLRAKFRLSSMKYHGNIEL